MVVVASVDTFGFVYLVMCLAFHVASQLLFVDHPFVILTVVAVDFFLFTVFVGR